MQRTVLITGCSPGGIGHALALEFHGKGYRVFATARKTEVLQDLHNLGIENLPLDVTDLSSIHLVRDKIALLTGGTLDILVNNAGRSYSVPASDLDLDEVKALFDVNLFAVMAMVKEFVPLLIAANGARVINIGSVAGVMPYVFGSAYNASKAALHAYGDTLRVELKPFNIDVITIVTGGIKSNISTTNRTLLPDSIYQPIRESYEKRVGHSQVSALATDKYAQYLVSKAARASHPAAWIWLGSFSWKIWFVDTFLPRKTFDAVMAGMFGLNKLARIVRQQRMLGKYSPSSGPS